MSYSNLPQFEHAYCGHRSMETKELLRPTQRGEHDVGDPLDSPPTEAMETNSRSISMRQIIIVMSYGIVIGIISNGYDMLIIRVHAN